MTTSGTYDYNPNLGELSLYAFNLCGLRNTSLTQEHYFNARIASNMVLASWANQGVNLWAVDLVTVPLVEGQSTYDVDANTQNILDAYCTIDDGNSQPIDRIILPISRTEYASYANKEQQGFPTTFWFNRQLSPNVTLWPVPDGQSAQYLKYYRMTILQDANLKDGQTVDMPTSWMEAFALHLAARLALIWNPAAAPMLKAAADQAYNDASEQNIETASQYISPMISGYFS